MDKNKYFLEHQANQLAFVWFCDSHTNYLVQRVKPRTKHGMKLRHHFDKSIENCSCCQRILRQWNISFHFVLYMCALEELAALLVLKNSEYIYHLLHGNTKIVYVDYINTIHRHLNFLKVFQPFFNQYISTNQRLMCILRSGSLLLSLM